MIERRPSSWPGFIARYGMTISRAFIAIAGVSVALDGIHLFVLHDASTILYTLTSSSCIIASVAVGSLTRRTRSRLSSPSQGRTS